VSDGREEGRAPLEAGEAQADPGQEPSRARRLEAALAGLSRPVLLTLAFGLVLLVAAGDLATGPDVSFVLLYLPPIALGTWFVSVGAGVALSIASGVVSVAADYDALQGSPVSTTVRAWNFAVVLGTYLSVVLLLAALRSRLEEAQALARTDALTRLPNRRAFFEMATAEIERVRRHGRPLTFAYVDCDDFKFVNDTLGHAQGDALLATVARTLRGATRAVDRIARLGGDEFGLLLPETDGLTGVAMLERLRATLLADMVRNGWTVGFSVGAATYHRAPRSVDEMMSRADELMYEVKRGAKGQIRLTVVSPLPSVQTSRAV
jgi:diguanylate cyclase (GGDEF)-like protein